MAKKKKVKRINEKYFSTDVCFDCRKKFTRRQKKYKVTSVAMDLTDKREVFLCHKCMKAMHKSYADDPAMQVARMIDEIFPGMIEFAAPVSVPKKYREYK